METPADRIPLTLSWVIAVLATSCGQVTPTVSQALPQTTTANSCPYGTVYNPTTGRTECRNSSGADTSGSSGEFLNQPAFPLTGVSSSYGQAGNYSAIPSSASPGRVKLSGQTFYSDQICVLPLLASSGGQFQVLRNSGQVVRLCKNIPYTYSGTSSVASAGLTFDFGAVQFNALAVVEQPFLSYLLAHIDYPNSYPTPPYAVGNIR